MPDPSSFAEHSSGEHSSGEDEALWLLEATDTLAPTVPLPIDPLAFAALLGLRVLPGALPLEVPGSLMAGVDGMAPTILLNQSDPHPLRRFTCAHIMAHYLLHQASIPHADCAASRTVLAPYVASPPERYANEFAAGLLMPAVAVAHRYRPGQHPATLALQFQVPTAVMAQRLSALGLVG